MTIMQTQSQIALKTLGLALVSSFSAIAFSTPAYSITINVDLSTFFSIGHVSNSNTITTIQSGTDNTTVDVDALESFLGFTPGSLDATLFPPNSTDFTTYGSAIKKSFTFNAGDRFSFDWISSIDTEQPDQAFVAINNAIQVLSIGSSYSYTFATADNYQIAMGVLDVNDTTGVSTLTLSNAQVQAVPWETDALPVVGTTLLFGIGIWRKYQASKSNNLDL